MNYGEIFSIWIVVWFIFYYIGIIPYSPKFALIFGLIENLILIITMIINNVRFLSLIQFSVLVFITKVIPFLLLKHETIIVDDIIFTLILFNIYLVWLRINGKEFYDNMTETIESLVGDKAHTPLMRLFRNLEKYLKDKRVLSK